MCVCVCEAFLHYLLLACMNNGEIELTISIVG